MSPAHDGGGRPILVYGAGGHGWVVAEAALAAGWRLAAVLDDAGAGGEVAGAPVCKAATGLHEFTGVAVIVAVGDNAARRALTRRLVDGGRELASVVHPSAWLSPSATLGHGVYVGPHAVVNAQATVGEGAIINSGSIIEHHARIGAFAHLAPRVALGGHVSVGELALLGVGAAVRPRINVGRGCTVGAGAVVVRDVADGATVVGVPARPR